MTMTTAHLLRGNLNAVADNLTMIWRALNADAWLCETCHETEREHDDDPDHDYRASEDDATYDDPHDALMAMPLEIVAEWGEPFAVVFCVGGPDIRLTGGGRSGDYVLTGHWGGTTLTVDGPEITRTGDYLRELCREVAA